MNIHLLYSDLIVRPITDYIPEINSQIITLVTFKINTTVL
jgi:hypothetical protein